MKKLFLTLFLWAILLFRATADEGMWLPMLLTPQVYNDMVKKGLKLTKEQLYSINKASLKDAIVIFGGGCTGEIVSADGLLFTNHHCGYEVITGASSPDHNYLHDGFYARNREEEVASTLSVQFLLRIEDLSKEVFDSLKGLNGAARVQKQSAVLATINKRMSDPEQNIETRISAFFKGNQFLAFVYQRYTDIRLVGTPPESVGDFGGQTDNWQWPRHSADFCIFRVYANSENKPAKYSAKNIPFKSRSFLPISIKGFKEGDYTMVFGYPGNTNRYESSYGVAMTTDITDPAVVKLSGMRLKYMMEEMKKDPDEKLKLSPSYAVVANNQKFYEGEEKQLLRYDIYNQKKKAEEKFITWAANKPEYKDLFSDWGRAYDAWRNYAKQRMYINQGIFGSPLMYYIWDYLVPIENALAKGSADVLKRALNAATEQRKDFLKRENKASDQNIVAAATMFFYNDIVKDQHPVGFYGNLKNKYGPLDNETTYKKYAADMFSRSMIFDDTKWNAFVAHPDAVVLAEDPAFSHVSSFYTRHFASKYQSLYQQFSSSNVEYGRLYIKGLMEMDTVKAKLMYPDATFTMRMSYGAVRPYRPRDAVSYDYVTTSKGILEKYKRGDDEFDLPANYLELLKKKDFGPYIDKQRNDLVIAFTTTNDITGGNSGSPVLNGNGEIIGLAFDGNYEALSHKFAYDKDTNRTLNVDIRYILWCIDKLGGASNIIKELKIVK